VGGVKKRKANLSVRKYVYDPKTILEVLALYLFYFGTVLDVGTFILS